MSKKVYIEVYGCTLNRADAATIKTALLCNGYEIVDVPTNADVIILNTCVVRYDTEVRMIKRLESLSRLGKKIVVAGCMARVMPASIRRVCPQSVLMTPQSVHRVVEAIEAPPQSIVSDDFKSFHIMPKIIEGVKVSIPVAEGCIDECSFCVVKVARPHLRSAPIEKVVTTIKEVLSMGAVEIEITAQDLSVYGIDLYGSYALPKLLQAILEIDSDDFIVRLGQLNPKHTVNYLDDIIRILRDPRVYKHLHIPVQSGNNAVLRTMNRGYNVEQFLDIIREVRNKVEGVHIATDIIVGHPGEDEQAFLDSVELISENYIDRVHIARFSQRPYTKSALMPQVPDPIKKLRSSYMEKVYEAVALELNREYIGSIAKVWITEIDASGNKAVGRLYNYRPVVLEQGVEVLGKRGYAIITDATFFDLRGSIQTIL
ncbi:MAG: tRNA (N(6)-L-threonylcarbamoyladenosine(37)-C(2))-methylthiotransferase [Ignisphaera sp.]|nr:tRNA (N(6)-L-threonylcarbamoyladenosine(37)-C(2))-methylthiotransferase [Ignisphaera sp.]MCX8168339.1 tRNA (N(6)-L-threonylcarbamoyladenosine(37)-C(2))-methylthiotransferase [Ignisphaera sp.]MDW8085328.1 tRNA (N(6)-L-threonylcarbamoyladenosine(37)-C(2))-methylthiotransferase [Ignisphaera sp.]